MSLQTGTFPQFSLFPREIQLLIWSYTLPAARVLEAALFDNVLSREPVGYPTAGGVSTYPPELYIFEPEEIANLRLSGSLAAILALPNLMRTPDDRPIEYCPDPVALHVCRLSRWFALESYRVMRSLGGNFYYDPKRDSVFLNSNVFGDWEEHARYLEEGHGAELGKVENVMLLATEWPDSVVTGPFGNELPASLQFFRGLREVVLLWEEDKQGGESEDDDMVEEDVEVNADGEVEGEETERGKGEGKEEDTGPRGFAESMRANFKGIVKRWNCTATSIVVIDRSGVVY